MNLRKIVLPFLLMAASVALAATPTCPNIPVPAVPGTQEVCHAAYISFYDAKLKDPRLVAYELTGPHTLGCVPRASGFHSEGDSAKESAYAGGGYDLGHMDPAQDNAWDDGVSKDSFSMVNVVPQLPKLNEQGWERLEESVRSWALLRGKLLVLVGPVFLNKNPAVINGVTVPDGFYKIVEDEKTGDVIAFYMPQKPIAKGDLQPWRVAVSEIRQWTGIQFTQTQDTSAPLWPSDLNGWYKAHKQKCGKAD